MQSILFLISKAVELPRRCIRCIRCIARSIRLSTFRRLYPYTRSRGLAYPSRSFVRKLSSGHGGFRNGCSAISMADFLPFGSTTMRLRTMSIRPDSSFSDMPPPNTSWARRMLSSSGLTPWQLLTWYSIRNHVSVRDTIRPSVNCR